MKKVVLKLDFLDEKVKQKAMKKVSTLTGVDSIAMDMKDKKLTVTGDVDPVSIVSKLRKICHTEIVSVGPAKEAEKKKEEGGDKKKEDEKKKAEEKKKEDEKKKAEALKAYYQQQQRLYNYQQQQQLYNYYNQQQQQQPYYQYNNQPSTPYKVVQDESPNCVIC